MLKTTIEINGVTYDFATTLRVAYEVQKKNSHKSYMEIFSGLNEMKLEDQIGILYTAFKLANPEIAKTMTDVMFREYYLDNYTVQDMMDNLKGVISGILGTNIEELEDSEDQKEGNS